MKKIVIVGIIAAALALTALNYHFIILDRNIKILKKAEMTFTDTWVDARGANKFKLMLNPSLVEAGFKELIEDARRAAE